MLLCDKMDVFLIVQVILVLLVGLCNLEEICYTYTFEDGFRDLYQDGADDIDWFIHSSYTQTITTGPSFDHTLFTEEGHYIYIEASNVAEGSKARLTKYQLPSSGLVTVKLWYHMRGTTMGTIRVYQENTDGSTNVLWSKSGDSGDEWYQAVVAFTPEMSYNLVFEGEVGEDYSSDAALDDIEICISDVQAVSEEFTCMPGNQPIDGMCTKCPVGYYKSDIANTPCTQCPESTSTSLVGATLPSQCVCSYGYELTQGSAVCKPCSKSYYKSTMGNDQCSQCPQLSTTVNEGESSLDSCVCVEHYTKTGGVCVKCGPGFYKPTVGNATCVPCSVETEPSCVTSTSEESWDTTKTVIIIAVGSAVCYVVTVLIVLFIIYVCRTKNRSMEPPP